MIIQTFKSICQSPEVTKRWLLTITNAIYMIPKLINLCTTQLSVQPSLALTSDEEQSHS